MEWFFYPAALIAGFAAGFINTLAGSGSLITLPLLIFAGLPANVANGTNRIAVLMQCAVSTASFKRQGQLDIKRAVILAIPAIIGAIVGAQIAVNLDEEMMRRTIGILMAVMLAVIIIRPRRWLIGRPEKLKNRPGILELSTFFAIGIYGGFIQAGVGIFLLAGLVLGSGYELVRANAVKNLLILIFTIFALIVFILNNQVNWIAGVTLGIGNMAGAWVAARMAVKRGARFVRWLLIAVVLVSAAVLLGIPQLIQKVV